MAGLYVVKPDSRLSLDYFVTPTHSRQCRECNSAPGEVSNCKRADFGHRTALPPRMAVEAPVYAKETFLGGDEGVEAIQHNVPLHRGENAGVQGAISCQGELTHAPACVRRCTVDCVDLDVEVGLGEHVGHQDRRERWIIAQASGVSLCMPWTLFQVDIFKEGL